jgi:hypothetical protein
MGQSHPAAKDDAMSASTVVDGQRPAPHVLVNEEETRDVKDEVEVGSAAKALRDIPTEFIDCAAMGNCPSIPGG